MKFYLKYPLLFGLLCVCNLNSTWSSANTEKSKTFLRLNPTTSLEINRYDLLELDIECHNIPIRNPFDPDEIDIQVHFNSPSGQRISVGAFWYQEYTPKAYQKNGEPGWKVRFTPTEPGEWTAQAEVVGQKVQSKPLSFQVSASDVHGFLRIHPQNPRYLAFDDGTSFMMIGTNICWWNTDPLADYERWFDALAANGGNTTRIWMAPWSFSIEWKDTGLGDYQNRMKQAWLLDEVFRMARERNIYIILVLLNHGQFSQSTNPEWDDNPHNVSQGGPLATPAEFATNSTAKELFKRRLRYIVNRWGYSPNLLAWEWWNEVNFTPISDVQLKSWVEEMTVYLRQIDVNQHLTTISYSSGRYSQVLAMSELDMAQRHEYTTRDMAQTGPLSFQQFARRTPDRPIAFTEFGFSTGVEDESSVDQEGIHFHNGLWGALFSGYASTAMYWWWDSYLEPLGLWSHFQGISRFVDGEDLARFSPVRLDISTTEATGSGLGSLGLGLEGEHQYLIWLRSRDYTAQSNVQVYEDALKTGKVEGWRFEPPRVEGLLLTLKDMSDGTYQVHWFDPQTAEWLTETEATAQAGRLIIQIPAFNRDLAAKISR